jgi:hypothetical protein
MMPGAGDRHGPVPGYRVMGSPRNGLPEVGGYRFRKQEDWDPYKGNHLDPSVVRPEGRQLPPSRARSRAEKFAEYCEARDVMFTLAEAAELVGIAVATAEKYECAWRAARAGASAGDDR